MDNRLPASFIAEFLELKRRVADLERAPRLTNAAVTGYLRMRDAADNIRMELIDGALVVYDNAGVERMRIGDLDTDEIGILIKGDTGQNALRISDDGWRSPNFPISIFYPETVIQTTSASYVTVGRGLFKMTSRFLRYNFQAIPYASTAGVRVRLQVFRGANPVVNVYENTGITTPLNYTGIVEIPLEAWGGVDPWNAEMQIEYQLRVVAGGGPVALTPMNTHLYGL